MQLHLICQNHCTLMLAVLDDTLEIVRLLCAGQFCPNGERIGGLHKTDFSAAH
jgi:hypothetical protein